VADVTGIASAATEKSNPGASAVLGWISLASGILSLGTGLAARPSAAEKPFNITLGLNDEFRHPAVLGITGNDHTTRWILMGYA